MASMIAPSSLMILVFFGGPLYCLPILVAVGRKTDKRAGIVWLNLLLGWTGVGWMAALVWACATETREDAQFRELEQTQLAQEKAARELKARSAKDSV